MNLSDLAKPFKPDEIEWRIGRCGNKNGKIWATCMAYVDARAVTHRLDEVCGPHGWRLEEPVPLISENKLVGFTVGISIKIGDEWIAKWDVADCTDIEPIKGGYSGAIRRSAALWQVGKYLYQLEEGFAETSAERHDGWRYQPANEKKSIPAFYWQPPALPQWALPEGMTAPPARQQHADSAPTRTAPQKPQSQAGELHCPECGKPMKKREAKTGKNAGSSFWGCTGYPACKKTMSEEAVAELAAQNTPLAECPEFTNSLHPVLNDIGCTTERMAQAVITFVRPGLTLASCKVNPEDATAVVDAIDARCQFEGLTFAEILNDSLTQAGVPHAAAAV